MAVKSLRMDLSSLILLRLMTMARVAMGDVIPDLGIDWDMMLVDRLCGVEVGVSRVLTSKAKQNCKPSYRSVGGTSEERDEQDALL